jgi:hypothetical protein
MLHFFLNALKTLGRENIALFWPIWIATTALGVMLVIWVLPKQERYSAGGDDLTAPALVPRGRIFRGLPGFVFSLLQCWGLSLGRLCIL